MTTNNPDSGNDARIAVEEFIALIRGLSPLRLYVVHKHLKTLAKGKKVQMWRFKKDLAWADEAERKQNGEQA